MSDTTQAIPRLLTYPEVAEALQVTERTVRTLCRAGELPYLVIGKGSIRFAPDDLARYLDLQRRGREVPK